MLTITREGFLDLVKADWENYADVPAQYKNDVEIQMAVVKGSKDALKLISEPCAEVIKYCGVMSEKGAEMNFSKAQLDIASDIFRNMNSMLTSLNMGTDWKIYEQNDIVYLENKTGHGFIYDGQTSAKDIKVADAVLPKVNDCIEGTLVGLMERLPYTCKSITFSLAPNFTAGKARRSDLEPEMADLFLK